MAARDTYKTRKGRQCPTSIQQHHPQPEQVSRSVNATENRRADSSAGTDLLPKLIGNAQAAMVFSPDCLMDGNSKRFDQSANLILSCKGRGPVSIQELIAGRDFRLLRTPGEQQKR